MRYEDFYIQKLCFDKEAYEQDMENASSGALFAGEESGYPFSIPAIRQFKNAGVLEFRSPVTIIIGENGSGKSTLIEAIAGCFGLNPEGGSRNFKFSTYKSHSCLEKYMYYTRVRKPRDTYFLRAESFYNVITAIENLDKIPSSGRLIKTAYGGVNLHTKSHGESFFALLKYRLGGHGFYIFDEPEAALSLNRQLEMLQIIKQLEQDKSQFIISTHSPVLMAYPGADIIELAGGGFSHIPYENTEQYQLMPALCPTATRFRMNWFYKQYPLCPDNTVISVQRRTSVSLRFQSCNIRFFPRYLRTGS